MRSKCVGVFRSPGQFVWTPTGNMPERNKITTEIFGCERNLQDEKTTVYDYVLSTYYELRFSSVPEQVFERTRKMVDKRLAEIVPPAVKKFVSVYDNLRSRNPEDWSNATHSCRRILQAVADVLSPPILTVYQKSREKGIELEWDRIIILIVL